MSVVFSYSESKADFLDYSRHLKEDQWKALNWLSQFDDSELSERERLNVLLTAAKWETDHGVVHDPIKDELYLYYEQYANGELDSVIEPEERETVVHDLTECFNKVFPEGLID